MDAAIPIVFPEYRITVDVAPVDVDLLPWFTFDDFRVPRYKERWSNLGHAGILFINGMSGLTKYYEYGRYDPQGIGAVRNRRISNVQVREGKIVQDSLRKPLHEIATVAGQSGRIEAVYIERQNAFAPMLKYAQLRESQNVNPKRIPYDLLTNSCVHFVKDVVATAGIETPWMLDPRPNSYIGEFRDDYPDLDYNPRTGELKLAA